MAGDYTRFRYNPLKDPTGILMQQGKVLLDQDWNENALLQDRRWRTETTDIMGRAVVPIETPNGFEILIDSTGANLTIGRGRMYVDGLMAENHGGGAMEFDPVLGEVRGEQPVPYNEQPYYTKPPALPTDTNRHLVYLDVWEREVTSLEDLDLVDKAVAVDTCTRLQTVWQVKVLDGETPKDIDCSTPSSHLAATAPSAGRLTTSPVGVPTSSDPCVVPLTGGFRGPGNRLYRVEIHDGGPPGTASFKWSRDNASVASAVTAINSLGDTLNVVMTRRDSVLRFQPGDWVEVTDDFHYFHGLPGEMAQVAVVNDANLTIQLKKPLTGSFDAKPESHTRVIRWDQSGIAVDANNGLIPIPAGGTAVVLEDGIQVAFSIDASIPTTQFREFRALEYWAFAARVVDASIEILKDAPPRGILHHYAWLGFVTFPGTVTSCRTFWPPEGCDCTVCVSALSHNRGTFTIQDAVTHVTQVAKLGGKICLGPGVYSIDQTVKIIGASAIEIAGHGLTALEATDKLIDQPVILLEKSVDISLENLTIAGGVSDAPLPTPTGLVIRDSSGVRVHRCAFVFGKDGTITEKGGRSLSPAIALGGTLVGNADIQWNFFNNVDVGIKDIERDPHFINALSIESNHMVCTQAGVDLRGPVFNGVFQQVCFAKNRVQSPFGFLLGGNAGSDVTVETNTLELLPAKTETTGILCQIRTIDRTRISNNHIFGDATSPLSNGVVLSGTMQATQVTGNRISDLTGIGIVINGSELAETIIAQNQLHNLGNAGIVMRSVLAVDLDIAGNFLNEVARATDISLTPEGMVGIQLDHSINVTVTGNVVKSLGLSPANVSRFGIAANFVIGIRVAGNRVLDIGSAAPGTPIIDSYGIYIQQAGGRIDVVDNEVRRSTSPPLDSDSSSWFALFIDSPGAADVSVRGNLLKSFGRASTVSAKTSGSCIFSENQCFWDSPGFNVIVQLTGTPVIASANYVNNRRGFAAAGPLGMLITTSSPGGYSVLGNIVVGGIKANNLQLAAATQIPQAGDTLNVVV